MMRIFIFCIFLLPFLNSCSRWEETRSQVRKDRMNPPNVGVLDEKNGPHALQDQLETGILSLDTDLVRAALEGGANANGEIGEGVTPIFLAVEASRFLPEKYSETDPETDSQTMEKKLRKLVRLLVEYGAELQHREETFGETPIFWAVKWGDARMTAILLENGAKTEAPAAEMQTSGGMTPLRKAVQMKHGAVLDVLLQDPAVQKQISEELPELLFTAAEKCRPETLQILLENGAELHEEDLVGHPPILYAAEAGNLENVRFLRKMGAELSEDLPFLHAAAQHGDLPMLEFLLQEGLDVNTLDAEGNSALGLAEEILGKGSSLCVRLREFGGKPIRGPHPHKDGHGAEILDPEIQLSEDILSAEEDGSRPGKTDWNARLWDGIENSDIHAVRQALRWGADPNEQQDGWNALMLLISVSDLQSLDPLSAETDEEREEIDAEREEIAKRTEKIAELLIQAGADPNVRGGFGNSLLHWAADSGELFLTRLAFRYFSDVHAVNKFGETPLWNAVCSENTECVRFLLAYGADARTRNDQGETFFFAAPHTEDRELWELLVHAGMDLNAPALDGRTPLLHAVESQDLEMVQLLLELGADLNASKGLLHHAAASGNTETAEFLLEKGLDIHAVCALREPFRLTPLFCATYHDQWETVRFLIRKGARTDLRDPVFGKTLLHWAIKEPVPSLNADAYFRDASEPDEKLLELLAQLTESGPDGNGLDVRAEDKQGETPLHEAARRWGTKSEIFRFLVEKGGDPQHRNADGETPEELGLFRDEELADQELADEELADQELPNTQKDGKTQPRLLWKLAEKEWEFASAVYRKMAEERDGNFIFSPTAVFWTCAMAAEGAEGETRRQLLELLGLEKMETEELRDFLHLKKRLESGTGGQFVLYSGVYIDRDVDLKQEWSRTHQKFFGSIPQNLDFAQDPDGSVQKIQRDLSVSEQTAMPEETALLRQCVQPQTRILMLARTNFSARWFFPFAPGKTEDLPFYCGSREKVRQVPTMFCEEMLAVWPGDGFRVLHLPYEERFQMYLFVPDEPDGLPELEKKLAAQIPSTLHTPPLSRAMLKLKLRLPRFRIQDQTDFRSILGSLGASDLFDPKKADLSRISDSRPLHFDFAQAHSEISVDEKGTQARSLFTMGGYLGGGLIPEELHVDRPFVFLIHDLKTGQILFMGRVMDPKEI